MPPNSALIAPCRSRSMSSMLSAPAAIPATRHATFRSALTPHSPPGATWSATRSASPARSASVITGTRPACDTRFGSSKDACVFARPCNNRSGSGSTLLCPRPLRTGRASFPRTTAQASPGGSQVCRGAVPLGCGFAPLAMSVHETERVVVRSAVPSRVSDLVFLDRFPDHPQPLFPFVRALRLVVGVQEQFPAERAAPVLRLEQAQGRLAEREWFPAAALVPVSGERGVVWRRRACHYLVPDDFRPDEPDEVGAAVAVAEHPPVLPGRVELAEVPAGHPGLRLVRVRAQRPSVGEQPQVVVYLAEHLLGHYAPVVRGPSPDNRVNCADNRDGVTSPEGAHLGGGPFPDPPNCLGAGHDEQLAVWVAADVEPQEIEPGCQVDDLCLVLVEGKTPGCQPLSQPGLDLFGLPARMAQSDKIICVPHQRRSARDRLRGIAAEL